jgi:hypothetical protein
MASTPEWGLVIGFFFFGLACQEGNVSGIYMDFKWKEGKDTNGTENNSREESDIKGEMAVCDFGAGNYDGAWDGIFLECFPSTGGGVV